MIPSAFYRRIILAVIVPLIVCIAFIVWNTIQVDSTPKRVYALPEPNPDRPKILKRVTTPVKRPHEITESEVELIEVTEEKVDRVENQKDESIPVDDKELKLFLELKEKKEESPFGFGEFPEVPKDYPEDVIWESDMQSEIEEYGSERIKSVELIDRVLVKLWKQGHQATSAYLAENGKIYPSFPYTVYVDWEYSTDSNGNMFISGGTISGYDGITDGEIDELMEGNIPSGITVLSYSDDGIDPYSFLNLD